MNNAIEVRGLTKAYNNFSLLDVSFSVPTGSIVGFIGENGAGKSTTIKCILDVIHPDAGEVELLGQSTTQTHYATHADIGVVYDECSFHNWMLAPQIGNFLKSIYPSWDNTYFQQLLQRFGLDKLTGPKDILKTYSRGMKMKLSLAVALAHHPKLLILDEATSGLDPVVRDEILDIFLDFIQQENCSIFFSSHITSDIEKVADYLVFIHKGRIVLDAEKDALLDQYGLVHTTHEGLQSINPSLIVGTHKNTFGVDLLVKDKTALPKIEDIIIEKPSIDDIMLYTIRGNQQ
ncbi:MAG: ABC transporter ATP-binding protein [Oscillospiraceae bacterium]